MGIVLKLIGTIPLIINGGDNRLKLLYVISLNYMNAFRAETEDYSFLIQGYPNIKKAHDGLHKRNIKDILGFIYFNKSLPRNYKAVVEFIERVDMIAPKGMIFLIAAQDGKDFDLIKQNIKPQNLVVKIMSGWTDVTDIVIKSCLATFILQNYDPYIDTTLGSSRTRIEPVNCLNTKPKSLQYKRIFKQETLELIDKVNLIPKTNPNLSATITGDLVLYNLSKQRNIFYRVRLAYIQCHFGNDDLLTTIQNDLKKACGNYTLANAMYRHMQEVYNNALNNGGVYKGLKV